MRAHITAIPDGLPVPRRYWAIAAWRLGLGISSQDRWIVNVALPSISRSLHASPATAAWVVKAFQIATAWRCPDCKSMLQEILRFPPDYSSRTRYETGKVWRTGGRIRHHSVIDLVEEET